MKNDGHITSDSRLQDPGDSGAHGEEGLWGRIELIESQPLSQRAAGFELLHDELLAALQRSDQSA